MQELIWPVAVAFAIGLTLGPALLPLLRRLKLGQNVRDDGPQSHLQKTGTPTMGGLLILLSAIASIFLFVRDNFEWAIFAALVTLGFGLIGFLDDYIKIVKKRSLGLKPYQKIIGQFGLALVAALYAYNRPEIGSTIYIPFVNMELDLGIFYFPFILFFVIGMVNSVNLTDGLDGLASGISAIVLGCFAIICYFMAEQAQIAGDTYQAVCMNNATVIASAGVGGCMAFLRYNSFPAKVFMGDTGSLGLGGLLSVLGILTRMEILLTIMCGMFVVSSLTSIIQTVSYKTRQKRVFKMAPLHHHFELVGMHESKVVVMYLLLSVALCVLGLLAVS